MSLLTLVRRVARQVGLAQPTVVMSSTEETVLQLLEWAQEGVDDIALRHDWTGLNQTQTLTGDGVTTAFTLASDFSRLSKMPAVSRDNSTSPFWPAGPLTSPSFIAASTGLTGLGARPLFKIANSGSAVTLTFVTAPPDDETYTVSYQSSKAILSSSSPVAEWTLDADTLIGSPERLLRLYLRYKWKQSKGLPYAEEMTDYERALETEASFDWGLLAQSTSRREIDNPGDEWGEPQVTV